MPTRASLSFSYLSTPPTTISASVRLRAFPRALVLVRQATELPLATPRAHLRSIYLEFSAYYY